MLELKRINKQFADRVILDEVSIEVSPGQIIGLVAPNGTGKTTLLNIVMNFLRPDSGKVQFNGNLEYSSKKKERQMRSHISFLPEIDDLYQELTGLEHIKYYARLWNRSTKKVDGIIEKLHMAHYVKDPVKTYSLGMRQRLCFAMLLAADTTAMLMDEVMNGLDPDNVELITSILIALKEQGKMILIASHLLENLDRYADFVLFLQDGKIYKRSKEEAKQAYIKISLSEIEYSSLSDQVSFPKGTCLIGGNVLCLPTHSLSADEVGKWTTFFYKKGFIKLSVGEIGTSEWYQEFYNQVDEGEST